MTAPKPTKTHHLAQYRVATGLAQRTLTRARIIECAIPVFAARGPDAPSIDDFVKAAGISRGTFYNYFQSTRELLDATFETLANRFTATIVPVVANLQNPVVRMTTALRLYYRWATADSTVAAFLSAVSIVGSLAEERQRRDLTEAMEAGLLDVPDLDLAIAIGSGVMLFELRLPSSRRGGDERGLQIARAILSGLGVGKSLQTKALAIKLPKIAAAKCRMTGN